jgi:hypothetical protein
MEFKPGDVVVIANDVHELPKAHRYVKFILTYSVPSDDPRFTGWSGRVAGFKGTAFFYEHRFKRLTEYSKFERLVLGLEEE